ncbi:polysaccharide biosynthesis C-terminal domain-containing protein [Pseudoxanthomonas daejeonensis]|uniref:lipopolysaccharide biosynthesis protein n=1 Tax=Pseudoxanthomonas daejeonensis TaxID=266062 RepID=UPI001F53F8EA|nr:polysaccharide biosynthesis C-terminal domain-containing protein [Pseudoxanthomonas daejeonensis]UNK57343.1 polysaccharide biosynthesis C-terminal domain-containing protein [Pseudoxanthomonas daejeonensis]
MIRTSWETRLALLSLSGQAVSYALGIVLARQLGVAGFESYVVAAAAFILMVTLVPQGLEKFTLKLVPTLLEHRQHDVLRGFLGFSCRRILLGSALVGIPVGLWAWHAQDLHAQTRLGIVISCVSLPAGALVHLVLEVLAASGRAMPATRVFRLVVPGTVLALVGLALALSLELHAPVAIAAWGVSWCVALVLMAWQLRRALPPPVYSVAPVVHAERWAREARPFWAYRVSLAIFAQGGIIALEWGQAPASAVGGFAVAFSTAAIAQVLATATNRVYASRLSLLLERGDIDGIRRLRRERLRWLAMPLLVYLLVVFTFAPELIGLFRPEFVADGAPALRILAASTALSTVLAMAPTYLKHRGDNGVLFRSVAVAALLQVMLLMLLVPRLGATGAAIACAIASTLLYGALAHRAHLALGRLQPPSA